MRWLAVLIFAIVLLPLLCPKLAKWWRRRRVAASFAKYVDPELVQHVIDHPDDVEIPRERMMSILLIDPRGLFPLAEQRGAEAAVSFLADSDQLIHNLIKSHGGWIEATIGGMVLCRVGRINHDARQCAAAALTLARAVLCTEGPFAFRVAISTGLCAYPRAGVFTLTGLPVFRVGRMIQGTTADLPLILDRETYTAAGLTGSPETHLNDEVQLPVYRLSNASAS